MIRLFALRVAVQRGAICLLLAASVTACQPAGLAPSASPTGLMAMTAPPGGYPGPPTPDFTASPFGYPGPPTPFPTWPPAVETAYHATQRAAATSLAPAPQPSPASPYVIGPRSVEEFDGHFRLFLPAGWWASLGGTMVVSHYDPEARVNEFQPGDLKIQMAWAG